MRYYRPNIYIYIVVYTLSFNIQHRQAFMVRSASGLDRLLQKDVLIIALVHLKVKIFI